MATYTYDPTAIGDEPKDRLRAMLGDVAAPFQLGDEELQGFYDLAPGIFTAAADACDALAGRTATDLNVSLGAVGISGGNASRNYLDLAVKYRARAVMAGEGAPGSTADTDVGTAGVAATGLGVSEMDGNDSDGDRPGSVFRTAQRWSPWVRGSWGRWP